MSATSLVEAPKSLVNIIALQTPSYTDLRLSRADAVRNIILTVCRV